MDKSQNLAYLGEKPPVFRIDLSLPPSERYVALATQYREKMRGLRGMFDEVIALISPKIPIKLVHWLAWLCLHKLYNKEETEELRGISRTTDIDMYLLICLNTVLDLLMGCTSGGVRVEGTSPQKTKMLHFRTLDWTMDPLRELVVQLEFVRGSDPKVLATSVTYVGFIGVLTGVRQDLSVSLNFRPSHDTKRNFAFYSNHLLVLLGLRQSISSLLRRCIFPPPPDSRSKAPALSTLNDIIANVPDLPTTAAYFIFCDGTKTVTVEKDYRKGLVSASESFIVITNHDKQPGSMQPEDLANEDTRVHMGLSLVATEPQTMKELIEDSRERHDCIQAKWDRLVNERNKRAEHLAKSSKPVQNLTEPSGSRSSLRLRQKRKEEEMKAGAEEESDGDSEIAITQQELKKWLTTYPVLNEDTHYATILDPSQGKVSWVRRYDQIEWV